METNLAMPASVRDAGRMRLLFVSDVFVVRDALTAILERDPSVASISCADPVEPSALDLTAQVDAVIVHTALSDGRDVARRLRSAVPHLPIIAFPLRETDGDVIGWAECGVTGYIPVSVRLNEFVDVLKAILRGEQMCSAQIAASLLRRVTGIRTATTTDQRPLRQLTRRERQVADLVASRLDDKEIAQYLNIGLATAKSHVHNLLRKLNVHRRRDVVEALRGQPPAWIAATTLRSDVVTQQ